MRKLPLTVRTAPCSPPSRAGPPSTSHLWSGCPGASLPTLGALGRRSGFSRAQWWQRMLASPLPAPWGALLTHRSCHSPALGSAASGQGGTSTRLGWQFSPPVPPLACPQGTGAAGVGEAGDGAGQSHSLLTQGVPGTSAGPRSWFRAQTDVLHTWPMGHIPMLGDGGQGSPLPQFPLWYRRRMTSRLRNVLSTGMGRWTAEPQSQGTAPRTVNPAGGGSGSGVSGGPEPLSAKALTLKGGHGGPG